MFRMSILHRYLLKQFLRNLFLACVSLIVLFLVFDFFDRIDNILPKDPSISTVLSYFLFKIPQFFVLSLPISFIVATLFTYGILSKNSEVVAMRAAGLKLSWLAWPLIVCGILFSLINLVCTETIVPSSIRRVKEIYNIDIKRNDKTGTYSQENIWWRSGSNFYSIEAFDSRDSSLHQFSKYKLTDQFKLRERVDTKQIGWLSPELGWTMRKPKEYRFEDGQLMSQVDFRSLPLTIERQPKDFFQADVEPETMTFTQLKSYLKQQEEYGQEANQLYSDLYAKLSFPFVVLICSIVVFPFAIKPARTGNMAGSFIAGVVVAFSYYSVHSFSLALGRAELLNPMLSAWTANGLFALIGLILFFGAEAPD